jgi:AraC-like DNA-binding protein
MPASERDEPPGLAGLGVACDVGDGVHAYLGLGEPCGAKGLLKRCGEGRVIQLTVEHDADVDPALGLLHLVFERGWCPDHHGPDDEWVDGNVCVPKHVIGATLDGGHGRVAGTATVKLSSRGCTGATSRYARIVSPERLDDLAHLRRARDLMDRAYAQPLDVATLARVALMSTAHFARQFRATYGETPYAYLMTRRIERAKALLRRGDLTVTEVCLAVGCSSLGSFSARFTELVGETPTAYRARDHSALASVPGCIAKDLTRPSRRPAATGAARRVFAP